MTVNCSKCGTPLSVTAFQSVNTDYAKDIAVQIISGDLFSAECHKCGAISHLEYDMLYNDMKHNAMIWVIHKGTPEYASKVEEARLPLPIPYKTTRIVEDMNALREKVACLERNRDDRIIELCKLFTAYNLIAKRPDFNFRNAFYTTQDGKEFIFLYDTTGKELMCELPDKAYDYLSELYFNSPFATQFEDRFAIVDNEWAETVFHPLINGAAEKLERGTPSTSSNDTNTEPLPLKCHKCNSVLPEDSEFCQYCGEKITPPAPPAFHTSFHNAGVSSVASLKSFVKSKKMWGVVGIVGALILTFIILIPTVFIPNRDYKEACAKLRMGYHETAIEMFEELDGYKDSEEKIKEAKYEYVLDHKNNDDLTTFEYLKELKKQDYKDSLNIYNDLYKWRITGNIHTEREYSDKHETTVSKYCTYFTCNLKITGGTPGEKIDVTHTTVYPDGDTFVSDWHWYDVADNHTFGVQWENGIYTNPQNGATGMFHIKIYNVNTGELIGTISTRITN